MTAPLASMTAFARCASTGPGGELAWELKAVNAKGLDLRLRCPPGFDAAEPVFRARIGQAVARGAVQATLTQNRAGAPARVRVDAVLLRDLVKGVADALPPEAAAGLGPLTLDGLLAVRGVVSLDEGAPAGPAEAGHVAEAVALLDQALQAFGAMRAGEGAGLRDVLLARLATVDTAIEAAERAPGRTPEAVLARLTRAVGTLASAVPALDPVRLHGEAMLLAMRADVREELDRLRLHAAAVRDLLTGGGPVGRRLDFLAQELAREANTLCAKSHDAELTGIGLSLRNAVEQIREQVQNLE